MPNIRNRKFETFNNGKLDIYEVKNRTLTKKKAGGVRFGDRTVGVRRFWEAKIQSSQITRLVAVLYVPEIEQDDIAVIGGRQFRIAQVQGKFDACPPCLYLSLESVQAPYRWEENPNGQ